MVGYSGKAELIPQGGHTSFVVGARLRKEKRSWSGSILRPEGDLLTLEVGSRCTLRLPDGKEGAVIVQRRPINWLRPPGGQRVQVAGSGPPPF